MKAILLVEDDAEVGQVVEAGLERTFDFQVEVRSTLKAGVEFLKLIKVAAIITDLNLPDSKGENTIKTLQSTAPDVPIIVLTGATDGISYARAIHLGAHDYLEKGHFSFPELTRCVLHAIERHRVRQMFVPIHESIDAATSRVSELRELINK